MLPGWSNVEPERRDSLCCWVQCDIFQCAQEGLQVAAKAKSCIKRGLYGEQVFSAVADTFVMLSYQLSEISH